MNNTVIPLEHYGDIVKKAVLFDVICGLHANGKSYLIGDVIESVKGGKDDGSPNHSES